MQKNEYACIAYYRRDGGVDIATGTILDVDSESVVIDYENVRGPTTPTTISLSKIIDLL